MPEGETKPEEEKDYVFLGPIAREQLDMQCQYASCYVGGRDGSPDLTEGLRIIGDRRDYHQIKIHQDDVAEFVRRVKEYQHKKYMGE